MSKLFLRTLRDDPADAEVTSHRLLVRAGYIRRVAPGIFTMLPLGLRVLRKIEHIIREEMAAIGTQELLFPALLPREPFEATGRWADYGDHIFRLKDRRGADYLLGPTHEEMFALAVRDLFSSYKDLPLALYQIQTKYRDEARPRAGLLRGREFLMKDSYSFDVDDAGLRRSYGEHRSAYVRVFDRLKLDYVICSATSGAMGGSASEEFLAVCDIGEDTFVRCSRCDYAANVEAVVTPAPPPREHGDLPAARVVDTPDTSTIETLVTFVNDAPDLAPADGTWTAADTLKNIVVTLVYPDGHREAVAIGLPGDRELDIKRLEAQVAPAAVEIFTETDFLKYPELKVGYIGPQVLGEKSLSGIRYLVDPRVVAGTSWITGANETGQHVIGLVAGRDFTPDDMIEAADVREGDPCPRCDGQLRLARGIEIGHVFQLGRTYAEALDLTVLDQNGKRVVVTMGSYGIGVSRAVAAVAEQTADDRGLCWPPELAPGDVHLVAAGKDEAVRAASETIATELSRAGLTVIYDDRLAVSAGVKFNDSELLGVPTIVVVGRKITDGLVEVKDRRTGQTRTVPLADVAAAIPRPART